MLQVGDNESFYMTFLRGTVGVLSLDALELCPEWDNRGESGGGAEHAHTKRDISASTTPGSGPESGVTANNVGGGKECSSEEEPPFLGEAQWQRLRTTLEEQVQIRMVLLAYVCAFSGQNGQISHVSRMFACKEPNVSLSKMYRN